MHQTTASTVFRPVVAPPHLEFLAPPEINYNFISLSLFQIAITASLSLLSPPPPCLLLLLLCSFPFSIVFHRLVPSPTFSHSTTLSPLSPLFYLILISASTALVFLIFPSPFILPLLSFSTLISSLNPNPRFLLPSIFSLLWRHFFFSHSALCGVLFLHTFFFLLCTLNYLHRSPLFYLLTLLSSFFPLLQPQCQSRLVWSQVPSSGWCWAFWCSLWSSTTWWGSWWRAASSASASGQWPACGRRRSASRVCARDESWGLIPSLAPTPAWPSWHSCRVLIWFS